MKKFLLPAIISLSFNILFISFITSAYPATVSTYYPSPSGNYTHLRLSNVSGGPNENPSGSGSTCYCAQNSVNSNGLNGSVCDIGRSGATYSNAGTIFTDSATGYLEICKTDGTVASYPGACFNRFATTIPTPPCPTNYEMVNATSQSFVISSGHTIASWSCCFTGQGTGTLPTVPSTKSGCFSIYSTGVSNTFPASCASQDPNAYDAGCDTIYSVDMGTSPVYKRNCCFNGGVGTNSINTVSSCTSFNFLSCPESNQYTEATCSGAGCSSNQSFTACFSAGTVLSVSDACQNTNSPNTVCSPTYTVNGACTTETTACTLGCGSPSARTCYNPSPYPCP